MFLPFHIDETMQTSWCFYPFIQTIWLMDKYLLLRTFNRDLLLKYFFLFFILQKGRTLDFNAPNAPRPLFSMLWGLLGFRLFTCSVDNGSHFCLPGGFLYPFMFSQTPIYKVLSPLFLNIDKIVSLSDKKCLFRVDITHYICTVNTMLQSELYLITS